MTGLPRAAVDADAQDRPVVLRGEIKEQADPVAAQVIDVSDSVAPSAENRDAAVSGEDFMQHGIGPGPDLHGSRKSPGRVALGDRPMVDERQAAEPKAHRDQSRPLDVLADVAGGRLGLAGFMPTTTSGGRGTSQILRVR